MTHYISVKDCLELFRKYGNTHFTYQVFLDEVLGFTPAEAEEQYGMNEENWWDFLETEFRNEVKNDIEDSFNGNHTNIRDLEAYRNKWAKKYAEDKKLSNGSTIKFFRDNYRNEGLMFWDSINKEIIEPFTEIDDYGSVPPRFVVGDGDFDPYHWIVQVEHNSYVFPSNDLIRDIKRVLKSNKDTVTINHTEYKFVLDENIKDLNNIFIEVEQVEEDFVLNIYSGDPEWRFNYKTMKNNQKKKKNNTMAELKNIYEGAPPSSMMPNGGPLYQDAKESWNINSKGGKRKTKKAKKTKKTKTKSLRKTYRR